MLDSCRKLEEQGWRVTRLGVGADGLVDLDELRQAVTDKTVLVSVMAANNEIGVLQPMSAISEIVHARGACCTPTPHRRQARSRSTSTGWAWICCR